jgi:hypothetical protein
MPPPHCGGHEPSLAQLKKWSRERNCTQVEETTLSK